MAVWPDLNVEEFLGASIYAIASEPDRAESFLVHWVGDTPEKSDFPRHNIIAVGPTLTPEQIQLLTALIRDGNSYWFGCRRCMSQPNFALRLWRGNASVDMLIDLNCAAWNFYGPDCREGSFCSVRGALLQLAKSLFPEYASALPHSVWKQGVIKRLVEDSRKQNQELGGADK